jgi:hypothetical protein
MTNTPLTPEERLSRLEGVYEHLATKADIANLKAELNKDFTDQIKEVRKSLNQLQGGIAVLGFVLIILQLWVKFTG